MTNQEQLDSVIKYESVVRTKKFSNEEYIKKLKEAQEEELKLLAKENKSLIDFRSDLTNAAIIHCIAVRKDLPRYKILKDINFKVDKVYLHKARYHRCGESASVRFSRGYDKLHNEVNLITSKVQFLKEVPMYVTWISGNQLNKTYDLKSSCGARFSSSCSNTYQEKYKNDPEKLEDEINSSGFTYIRSGNIVNIYDYHSLSLGDSIDLFSNHLFVDKDGTLTLDNDYNMVSNVTFDAVGGSSCIVKLDFDSVCKHLGADKLKTRKAPIARL